MRRYRDTRGYGATPPNPAWPGEARLAVQIVLDCGGPPEPGDDYATRVGFWRLHRLLTGLAVPVTVISDLSVLMQMPEAMQAMQDAGWELAGRIPATAGSALASNERRRQIVAAVRLHEVVTGAPARGWHAGGAEPQLFDLVAAAGRFAYIGSASEDDLPYWHEGAQGAELILPLSPGAPSADVSERDLVEMLATHSRDTFDTLYAEGSAGRPGMMSVVLPLWLAGRPGVIAALTRLLAHMRAQQGVWIARRLDVAGHWAAAHPYAARALVPSRLSRDEFVATFSHVFRNGVWIAERAWDSGLLPANDSPFGVFFAMRTQFRSGSDELRLAVVKGSTPLDVRVHKARIVDDPRDSETMDVLTAAQKERLLELFEAYRQKFGFDVIFLVRNYTTASLLQALEERLLLDREREMAITFSEVEGLARMYIEMTFESRAA